MHFQSDYLLHSKCVRHVAAMLQLRNILQALMELREVSKSAAKKTGLSKPKTGAAGHCGVVCEGTRCVCGPSN